MLRYGEKGNGAAAHVTRARAIRGRSRRLPLVAFVLVIFFSILFGRYAFAEDVSTSSAHVGVMYHSSVTDSEQYIVSAYNKYDAAAYVCGYSPTEVASWDLTVRYKLSTRDTAFLTLANSMQDATPWNEDSLWDSLAECFGSSVWDQMTQSYSVGIVNGIPSVGFNISALTRFTVRYWQDTRPSDLHIWATNTTQQAIGAAQEAIRTILSGDDAPSIDNVPAGYVIVSGGSKTGNVVDVEVQDTDVTPGPSRSGFHVDFSQTTSIFEGNTNYIVYVAEGITTNNEPTRTYKVWAYGVPDGVYLLRNVNENLPNSVNTYYIWNSTNTQISYKYTSNDYRFITDASTNTYSFGQQGVYTASLGAGRLERVTRSTYSYAATNAVSSGGDSGGGDEPSPWPEPEPPEQPNVPEPPDVSPPPIGGPVYPTDPPEDPTTTPEPEPTGTDYTIYLKAIIRQLNQIMVQMSNHCKHIRDQISTSANAIISNLHTYIEDLQESIDSNFSALNDYLEDLTKWYEDFTQDIVDGIQDEFSTVESILRQILRKIGVSRGTPKEIETEVDDDFNFLEWLINFIASKLSGVIGDFVGDVGALLNGIKHKFPFSIPWDIMALLALLDGTPVTPRFTVTIPAINGWWSATSFVIDLSEYNSVASVARFMINAWWVLVLAMKTDWMLMIMGNHTSLGERFANRVTGGE